MRKTEMPSRVVRFLLLIVVARTPISEAFARTQDRATEWKFDSHRNRVNLYMIDGF